jgi:hypothetical protein
LQFWLVLDCREQAVVARVAEKAANARTARLPTRAAAVVVIDRERHELAAMLPGLRLAAELTASARQRDQRCVLLGRQPVSAGSPGRSLLFARTLDVGVVPTPLGLARAFWVITTPLR